MYQVKQPEMRIPELNPTTSTQQDNWLPSCMLISEVVNCTVWDTGEIPRQSETRRKLTSRQLKLES
jgi:hypothetical protein